MNDRTNEILGTLKGAHVYNIEDLIRQLDHADDNEVIAAEEKLLRQGEWAPATIAQVRDAVLEANKAARKPVRSSKADDQPRPKPTRKR